MSRFCGKECRQDNEDGSSLLYNAQDLSQGNQRDEELANWWLAGSLSLSPYLLSFKIHNLICFSTYPLHIVSLGSFTGLCLKMVTFLTWKIS